MTKTAKASRALRAAKTTSKPAAIAGSAQKRSARAAEETTAGKTLRKPKRVEAAARPASKLAILEALLRRQAGMTIADACQATGWQAHSVRGAIAGALKKRGPHVVSKKTEGVRTYHTAAIP